MPLINANGCDFYYEMQGSGPDLVFIHGEIHGLEYWEHQLAELATDHRCLAYNRRGHAKTRWTDYGFSLTNQTRDLEQLIGRLGIARPVLVALAFGTTIAASYAIRNPDKVRGIVLGAWSELHDAFQYFERWGSILCAPRGCSSQGRGRSSICCAVRAGRRSIGHLIDSPVREEGHQMFASHPLGSIGGACSSSASVPNLITVKTDIPVLGLCGGRLSGSGSEEVLAGMVNFREGGRIAGARVS
jgi:pimeloyl-ACP methyl ester carboxylesterase